MRESGRLNPSDGIALFLLGIVEDTLGNRGDALSAFLQAARTPGPVQARSMSRLRDAHSRVETADTSFEDFVSGIAPPKLGRRDSGQSRAAGGNRPGRYAGSAACLDCHEEVYDAWAGTGMAKMFRPYDRDNVIGDFDSENRFLSPEGDVLARMLVEGGRHYFELPAGNDKRRFRVDYTIGSKWQQAYATKLPDGTIHVIPLQYNALHDKWVNFWEVLDDGPSERSRVRDFHRMQSATSYQIHCAPCHTSQAQAEGALIASERIVFREPGINCEMCHGPSAEHSDSMREGRPAAGAAGEPPLRFGALGHRTYVDVCAQCHMQSGIVEAGPRGELNFSGKQATFLNPRRQRPYEDYSRSAFYKDGRFRETTFIVEAFMRTACFRRGEAHCGHCHDPHPADSASNPESLKFREDPDRMCLQCHESLARDPSEHTRHETGSEASRCTACHMPKIMNSMMFMAGTHRIDDIPDAAMTERFGREESPNACLDCHGSEPAAWLARSLAEW